ncbi:MAG: hypothetical protein AB1404_02440 [Spirochaetota bacterium]
MKEILQPIAYISIFLASIYFVCWIRRERFTFLGLSIDTKIINQVNGIALVSITVTLENKGKTRIEARRKEHLPKDLKNKYAPFLYSDDYDQCKHAGTLKIRQIPDNINVNLFDWYSLDPLPNMQILKDGLQSESDFEQINYLDEYEYPPKYEEVIFWIEPNESYSQQVMVCLPQGIYVLKAFFLGKETKSPKEDEYWSRTKIVKIFCDKNP